MHYLGVHSIFVPSSVMVDGVAGVVCEEDVPESEFQQISQFFAIFRNFCDSFQNSNVFQLKISQNFSDFHEFSIFLNSGKF